jgi:hypothetical protein
MWSIFAPALTGCSAVAEVSMKLLFFMICTWCFPVRAVAEVAIYCREFLA